MTDRSQPSESVCPMSNTDTDEAILEVPLRYPSALEPPVEWADLREHCPVAPVHTVQGHDALMLTRYSDVRTMLADPRFVREVQPEGDAAQGADDMVESGGVPSTIASGPGHLRWRRLMSRTFTIKRVRAMQPRIEEIANQLVDSMIDAAKTAEGGTLDLKTVLGFPLPVYVICELLGVPVEDRKKFSSWSDHTLNLTFYTDDEVRVARAELWDYLAEQVAEKRAHPGDDLLSELTAVTDSEDGRMSEVELIVTAQALLVAGHETTANMIGKMISLLLSDRTRWEQLLADPTLVNSAVEEVLRFDANLGSIGMRRQITEQIEIADTVIEPGTTVIASQSAANRDEHIFDAADEMDLTRSPNPHITFGVGPHSCLGQSLARVELQTVLTTLLTRLPTLELSVSAADLRRREGFLVGGLQEVPVRW